MFRIPYSFFSLQFKALVPVYTNVNFFEIFHQNCLADQVSVYDMINSNISFRFKR